MITEAENLIIANATDAQKFQQTSHCEMQSVRGQVTLLPALGSSTALKTVICTDGYLSPARKGQHCIGATFSPNDTRTDIRVEDHQSNLNMLKSLAPEWGKINYDLPSLQGRASIRATTNDYLPLAGAILDTIHCLAICLGWKVYILMQGTVLKALPMPHFVLKLLPA